jgi:hypothetical protein
MRHVRRLVLGFVLATLAVSAPLVRAAVIAEAPARIVAVGDLHADFDAWRAIARDAGLIDARGRWTGGATVLVQMGDIPDRGPDSRSIVEDLMRLEREAVRAGGRVIVLVGNHEAMMLTGDMRYVSAGEIARFADRQSPARREAVWRANQASIEAFYRASDPAMEPAAIRKAWLQTMPLGKVELMAAWHPKGAIGRWVLDKPAVARVGETLFVHGGIGPAYLDWPLERLNAEVRAALAAQDPAPDAIINDPDGPLWFRGYAHPEGVEPLLAQVLERHGVKRKVIAHTPHRAGILLLSDGRLARIDTGISTAYGGTLSWLEIAGDRVVAHLVQRPPQSSRRAR